MATAAGGADALQQARRRPPDLVLLDLGLPDLDGTDVIRELRGWCPAPVIVLSGRAGSGDKIGALEAGADDYVTKPFDMEELVARLHAALRRAGSPPPAVCIIGHHKIDVAGHTITRQPQHPGTPPGQLHLTPTEWSLLEILLGAPGSWSAPAGCSRRCGGPGSSAAPTISGSTWPGCAASWRTTRTARATC